MKKRRKQQQQQKLCLKEIPFVSDATIQTNFALKNMQKKIYAIRFTMFSLVFTCHDDGRRSHKFLDSNVYIIICVQLIFEYRLCHCVRNKRSELHKHMDVIRFQYSPNNSLTSKAHKIYISKERFFVNVVDSIAKSHVRMHLSVSYFTYPSGWWVFFFLV